MGSSIQIFSGRAERFNDLDLIVLLQFVSDEVTTSLNSSCLQNAADAWNASVRVYGPGVLNLALEERLQAPGLKSELVEILKRVRQRVVSFGEKIPAHILNERNLAPGVTFNEYPTQLVVDAAMRLEKLVTKTELG